MSAFWGSPQHFILKPTCHAWKVPRRSSKAAKVFLIHGGVSKKLHSPARWSSVFFFNGNLLCIARCVSRVHFGVVLIFFPTKTPVVPMVHGGWSGFSANWEVRTETPFSVMTRSGFTFRMSSQTRRISSYGVGFFSVKSFSSCPLKKRVHFYISRNLVSQLSFFRCLAVSFRRSTDLQALTI